jgi:hypothetical protein
MYSPDTTSGDCSASAAARLPRRRPQTARITASVCVPKTWKNDAVQVAAAQQFIATLRRSGVFSQDVTAIRSRWHHGKTGALARLIVTIELQQANPWWPCS